MRGTIILAVTIAGATASGLSGCVQAGPSPEAVASLKEAAAECKAQFAAHVERAHCVNDALDKFIRPTVRYADLLDVLEAERVALAEKMDAGTMTQAEADLALTKAEADINSEADRRSNSAAIVAAQQSMAISAAMPVSCTTFGNVTNCY
jgi:hypothetical protein